MARHHKTRTYARTRAISRRGYVKDTEPDSLFFLKLVVVLLLASLWLKFASPLVIGAWSVSALPLGFLVGLLAINSLEHLQTDRKIWYATLLLATITSYFLPAGIVI
ncbi:hypothetical protein CR983_02925 [Candidatus Saccharibacteria bacterium]|nr:MAG: hypothetical protein CR983_02925 [Candidatus Saccharibacteria bacterium]